jgi:hypothetical protein
MEIAAELFEAKRNVIKTGIDDFGNKYRTRPISIHQITMYLLVLTFPPKKTIYSVGDNYF